MPKSEWKINKNIEREKNVWFLKLKNHKNRPKKQKLKKITKNQPKCTKTKKNYLENDMPTVC